MVRLSLIQSRQDRGGGGSRIGERIGANGIGAECMDLRKIRHVGRPISPPLVRTRTVRGGVLDRMAHWCRRVIDAFDSKRLAVYEQPATTNSHNSRRGVKWE